MSVSVSSPAAHAAVALLGAPPPERVAVIVDGAVCWPGAGLGPPGAEVTWPLTPGVR